MIVIPLLIGLVPGLVWLFFFMQEDTGREPLSLIGLTFVVGAVYAFIALVIQLGLTGLFKNLGIAQLSIASIILLALVEEVCKYLAAYFTVHRNPTFDVPVDAMTYIVAAALGFATVENLAIAGGAALSKDLFFDGILQTLSLRFVGATLLHALTSGLVGYYWAIGMLKGRRGLVPIGIVLATGLHAFFNYLIITYGNAVYSVLFLAVIGFFVLSDFERLRNNKVNVRD